MNIQKQRFNFFLFCMILGFCALVYVAGRWSNSSIYVRPYEAVKQQRGNRDASADHTSQQPDAPGLKESEIKRYKGDRYDTY